MKHCWFCLQRLVDKAVMVTKADLMEPQDKFHRAGAGAGAKRGGGGEEDAPFTPNLESIREDSCECRPSSEDEHSRYVVTGHTLTSVGWGQDPGLSMEGWMELGVRLGGGRGGVESRARLGSGGVRWGWEPGLAMVGWSRVKSQAG